jgi:hypothetical protein
MESIDLLSFITFFLVMLVGSYAHYRKVCKQGRHFGTLFEYVIADYPGKSASVGLVLIGASWAACTSGMADSINPELVYSMLSQGKIHIPSVTVAVFAWSAGWAFDSALNKGGAE